MNDYLEAARIQGFKWGQKDYSFNHDDGTSSSVSVAISETVYRILALRYKELFSSTTNPGGGDTDQPYEIDTYLTEINTDRIDTDYMQSRFEKYIRLLNSHAVEEEVYKALTELHKSFATLNRIEQRFANQILADIQSGALILGENHDMRSYLNEYMEREKNDRIHRLAESIGLDEDMLRKMYDSHPTSSNINEFGRFDQLVESVDRSKARAFIESQKGEAIPRKSVTAEIYSLLRRFLIGNLDYLFNQTPSNAAIGSEINIGTNIEHANTIIINSKTTE